MTNTFLITGCCGFIGSNMCKHLINDGHRVIGIDNLLTGSYNNIKDLIKNKKFSFIEHDICKEISISEKIDKILHFASPASPKDYLKYPIKTLQIGSKGTENILNTALKHSATILLTSTSEIYGDPLEHPQKETYYGNVNPIGPRGVYDEAKRYLEALATAYHRVFGLDIKIARIFNTYGPKMRIDDGRAIPNFISQALDNKDLSIYGDGSQTRSFCYIDDTILGIIKLLNSNYNLPVNIGNPEEFSINELSKIIKDIVCSKSKNIYLDLPENDPKVRKPNIKLAQQILNWEPKIKLKEGLKKTINYFREIK